MSFILKLYYYINLVLGGTTIHYDSKTNNFQLYHWPTIILCGFINMCSLAMQQYATYFYFNSFIVCEQLGPLVIINILLLFTNYMAYMVILAELWLKRKRIYRLCKRFKSLLKYYLSDLNIIENHDLVVRGRNCLLKKWCSAFCEILVLCLHLFGRLSVNNCTVIKHSLLMACSLYFTISGVIFIIVDINIYMGLLFIELCVNMLLKRLKQIERDVKLMHLVQRIKNLKEIKLDIHRKWRIKLLQDICLIAKDESKLKNMAEELIAVYQLQLLFLLLYGFLSLVALMFYILNYLVHLENNEIVPLFFMTFVIFANISNNMLLFDISESLVNSFKIMGFLVYKIDIYASSNSKELFRRDILELSLESLLLQIQYRQFHLNVCGLFDIRNKTSIAMLSAIIINLMYLIQSVMQNYNHNRNTNIVGIHTLK